MPTTTTTQASTIERVRQNIRVLKALRQVSDQRIAESAGFSSRQMVADRINGRTPIDLIELDAIAATLSVEPMILMGNMDDLVRWVTENPDYKPERAKPRRRKAAPRKGEAR